MVLRRNAPAKINLGLHVLRRRPDGYHDIETVFVRIPWSDVLTAELASSLQLTSNDPHLPTGDDNLVMRAARRLDPDRGASLHLEKHLPMGAGLGGGSSNAAAALLLLDELWELNRSHAELLEAAGDLGSDVAFFVDETSTAIGTGRGEQLEPLVDPDSKETYVMPFPLVVAVSPVHVSTAQAYRWVTPNNQNRPDLKAAIMSQDLDRWRAELSNDFERPILAKYPSIAETKAALTKAGAAYASLSGSGSAVFGVFEEGANAEAAAEALCLTGHSVWHGSVDG